MGTDQPKVPGTTSSLDSPDPSPEDGKSGLDNPTPGPEKPRTSPSTDLRSRANQLRPGHPSSPVEADGSPKPPEPRLKDIGLPEPLTDAEHAEHVKDVRDRLDKARVRGLATDEQHTIDRDARGLVQGARALPRRHHRRPVSRAADVPCERRAIIAGGLSGAGKSTVLDQYAGIDRSQYLTINPDKIKEEMADRGMVPRSMACRPWKPRTWCMRNPRISPGSWPCWRKLTGRTSFGTSPCRSQAKTERRIDELRAAGYTSIQGIFVDIPVETAVTRVRRPTPGGP